MNNQIIQCNRAINLAKEFAHFERTETKSSALYCIDDAEKCFADGNYDACLMWAKRSLSHSVGIFHPAYQDI